MSLAKQITVAANNPDGVSRDELLALTAIKYTLIDAALSWLRGKDRIFAAKVSGQCTRYFNTQPMADAWAARQTPIPSALEQIRAVFAANPKTGYSMRLMHPLLVHCSKKTCNAVLLKMAADGELIAAYHPSTKNRYFTDAEAARAYSEKPASASKPKAFKVATPSTAARARSSRPVEKKVDTREVITPPHVVVQQGPCAEVFSPYQLTNKDAVQRDFRNLPLGATLYGMMA